MRVIRESAELKPSFGGTLVPTMGALHEGHLALVRAAAAQRRPVVVSVFVNPTQFGPGEDLDRYPRTLDEDLVACSGAGADLVFAPATETIYPADLEVHAPPLPAVATEPGLEDARRPSHFEGVCQVVSRLFDLTRPSAAVFGEKDYQQLRVIEAMTAADQARWPGLEIVAHPTVRERDGLAMSSRNRYLSPDERERALGLSRALQVAHAAQRPETAEQLMHDTLSGHDLEIEYAVVRDAETLLTATSLSRRTRALIAARVGDTRLIDNAPMTVWR